MNKNIYEENKDQSLTSESLLLIELWIEFSKNLHRLCLILLLKSVDQG